MEILNATLNKHCQMIYFWKGQVTTLGALSNKELESIIKFINKYPQGLLNGYEKTVYLHSVKYILDWREGSMNKSLAIIESRILKRAEQKAEELTLLVFQAFKETSEKSSKQYCLE